MKLPRLIVFDLDFTLWDCGGTWCDCLCPPFALRNGQVEDADRRHVRLYDCVPGVLEWCDENDISMALASRTEQPSWARQLVEMLGIANQFQFAEIYPTSKLKHFAALSAESGVAFDDMLFFDDEMRNIREVGTLGVTCMYVEGGFRRDTFDDGLAEFADR